MYISSVYKTKKYVHIGYMAIAEFYWCPRSALGATTGLAVLSNMAIYKNLGKIQKNQEQTL